MKHVLFIHGIQPERETFHAFKDLMREYAETIPENDCKFRFFDWSEIIRYRQEQLWQIAKKYGNYLTKKVRKGICFLGTDMMWLLQRKRDGSMSDMGKEVFDKLEGEVKLYLDDPEELWIVCHSWGTWVAVEYSILHPEKNVHLLTIGSPLLYNSPSYKDWGSPSKLSNIVEWINLLTVNDPIALPLTDNPNEEWKSFVKDIETDSWTPFPMKAHSSYFDCKKAKNIINEFLTK